MFFCRSQRLTRTERRCCRRRSPGWRTNQQKTHKKGTAREADTTTSNIAGTVLCRVATSVLGFSQDKDATRTTHRILRICFVSVSRNASMHCGAAGEYHQIQAVAHSPFHAAEDRRRTRIVMSSLRFGRLTASVRSLRRSLKTIRRRRTRAVWARSRQGRDLDSEVGLTAWTRRMRAMSRASARRPEIGDVMGDVGGAGCRLGRQRERERGGRLQSRRTLCLQPRSWTWSTFSCHLR